MRALPVAAGRSGEAPAIVVRIVAPGPGRVTASAAAAGATRDRQLVAPAARVLRRAGASSLTLRLSPRGARMLARHGTVSVVVRVTYTARGGARETRVLACSFGPPAARVSATPAGA